MTRIENHCCDCAAHHTGAERLFLVGGVELCMDCVASIAERNGIEVEDLIEGEV